MDRTTKNARQTPHTSNIKDLSDKSHLDMSLGGDNIMSLGATHLYSTIAQADFKDTNEDHGEDVDRKKIREKTRKDKIRQGIHKLSELLPDNYHNKEGQKETLVSILEKAAEFMTNMTKPGEEETMKDGEGTSDKINTDVLKEFKDGLDSLKSVSEKDLGSEMEAALSLMAGTVGDHDSLETANPKFGGNNNNTMDIVTNENQDTNISMGNSQNSGEGKQPLMQNNQSINMQGLGDHSFMSGMGSGMFGDGPLLPSLMSPMLPGSAIGGMLGSFPGVNSNLMQTNNMGSNNMSGVNNGNNTHSNLSNTQSFSSFGQDSSNLFMSPSSVNTGTPGGNSTVSNQSTSLLDSALQTANIQPQRQDIDSVKVETTQASKSESHDSNILQMPFGHSNSQINNFSVQSQGSSDNKTASSVALYTQAGNIQSVGSSSVVNTNVILSSASMTSNMTVNPSINVGNNFVGMPGTSMGSFNVGQQGNLQTVGNISNLNQVPVSGHSGSTILPAPQKGTTNLNATSNMLAQQQVGGIHPTPINQNLVMPQVQGTPVGPLQGTLVLHNNQLILVPNNQQQVVNAGLTINQNLQGNMINQGALQAQGVIGGGVQNLPVTGMQNIVNAGIHNSNQIAGIQTAAIGGNMQNIISVPATQAQALHKTNNIIGTTQRVGFNQQQVVGNTGMLQTNQGTLIQTAVQPGAAVSQASAAAGGSGAATVNINTPGGVVQMNTAPSAPNQLPSALILPNGQIVPVVTQPNVVNQTPQQHQNVVQQPGGSMVIHGNQISANQGGQLTIQTPGNSFGGNQIIGSLPGGTGLLMTTAMTQGIKSNALTTIANTGMKSVQSQPHIQHFNPGANVFPITSSVIKGPILMPTKSVPISQTKNVVSKVSGHNTKTNSSKSSKSSSKSSKKLVTNLPTTVQAMLTPEGNIILSLPPGANPGSVLGKPLTPVTSNANNAKLPVNKKTGQRIIMPKPISGAPVATIAPLLPGQSTNIMVTSSIATPTIAATGGLHKGHNGGNMTPSQLNPGNFNQMPVAVQGSLPTVGIATPSLCSQAVNPPAPITSLSTDILAKAAESIFQASPGGAMSPGFYNHANDDNPLQIDDTTSASNVTDIQHHGHMMNNTSLNLQRTQTAISNTNTASKNSAHSMSDSKQFNNGGAKPKVLKPKDSKPAKPKKKTNKENKSAKAQLNNKVVSRNATNQFLQMNNQEFTSNGEVPSNFSIGADHFMPDLADSLDDGDDESDINDFQDLIRLHEPKPKTTVPSLAQTNNVQSSFVSAASSPSSLASLTLEVPATQEPNITSVTTVTSTMSTTSNAETVANSTSSIVTMTGISSAISSLPTDLVTSWITTTCISPSIITNALSTPPAQSSGPSSVSSVQTNLISPVSTLVSEVENEPKYTLSPSLPSEALMSCSTVRDKVVACEALMSGPTVRDKVVACEALMSGSTVRDKVVVCEALMSGSTVRDKVVASNQQSSDSVTDIQISLKVTDSIQCSLPTGPNDLMGLTPMEIIQSIAENSGKEKQEKEKEKSPKENKEPSPRISQKKLAKAGKGPPGSNFYKDTLKSPKRSEQSKSPKKLDHSKSPKRTDVSKSPKRILDSNLEPAEYKLSNEKLEQSSDQKFNYPEHISTSANNKSSLKKETKGLPNKKEPKRSPKKEGVKDMANKEEILKKVIKNISTSENNKETIAVEKSNDSSKKQKLKVKGNKQGVQERDKKVVIDDYPDEPPTLEREEPFPLPNTMGNDTGSEDNKLHEKHGSYSSKLDSIKGKDENIFMNAIISEKSDYFRSGPSLFSQSSLATIPPFTNASLPPPPFGFGTPPFFRFPMMNTSAGLAGFQHHLPMFRQAPPLFSNSFGEVPYKFSEHPLTHSPRGGTSFGGSDIDGKSPRSSSIESKKDRQLQKTESKNNQVDPSQMQDLAKVTSDGSNGKRKKKSKKEKRDKEKPFKNSVNEKSDIAAENLDTDINTQSSNLSGFTKSEISEGKFSHGSSPVRSQVYLPTSEATSHIDIMPSSEFAPPVGSSCYPDKTSETSDRSIKRKKTKKKKKERRKRDKSESEYEFEIVQHTVTELEAPSEETKQCSAETHVNTLPQLLEEDSKTVSSKGRKSRSRTRKKISKSGELYKEQELMDQPSATSEIDTVTKVVNEGQGSDISPSKDRKTYSLRGRGLSPKGTMEEPPADIFEDDRESVNKSKNQETDVSVAHEELFMTKISPLKQSPLKCESEEIPKAKGRNKSKGRGKSKSKKGKIETTEESNTADLLPNVSNEPSSVEQQNKGIKLKILNKLSSDDNSNNDIQETSQMTVEENNIGNTSSGPGKLLKTNRAQRKSDASPPKLTKFSDLGGSAKKNRRPSPLKKLPKGSKNISDTAQSTPTKNGPFDVFDFDDEPEEQLPTTLKSFTSKTKEHVQAKQEQPSSPAKQPILKLKLGTNRDIKAKVDSFQIHPELDRTMSSEFADTEFSFNTPAESDAATQDIPNKVKKGKKTIKSRKKSKKGNITDNMVESENIIGSSIRVESTDSELNQSQDSIIEVPSKKAKGRSRKPKKVDTERGNERPVHLENLSSDNMVIDTQGNISGSENDGNKSDRESSNIHKEHVGLDKTIKALHERLQTIHSTSPIRLPAVIPGFEEIKERKSKSKKRGRDSSQSEGEALDLTIPDETSIGIKYGPVPSSGNSEIETEQITAQRSGTEHLGTVSGQGNSLFPQDSHKEKLEALEQNKSKVITDHSDENLQKSVIPAQSKNNKKSKTRSRKRSKDEANLDQPTGSETESGSLSEPTSAKVQKVETQSTMFNLNKQTDVTPNEPLSGAVSQQLLQHKKGQDKKPRKRVHSSKGKHKHETNSGIVLEGSIPDTITFSENDLFAVLDQVEGQNSTINADESAKLPDKISSVEESVPVKKSKFQEGNVEPSKDCSENLDSAQPLDSTQDKNEQSPLVSIEKDITSNDNAAQDVPLNRNEESQFTNEVTRQLQNPCSDQSQSESIQSSENSPSKKEKKKDRKKRRKEKHAVREMSEGDLSRREPFVIPDLTKHDQENLPEKDNIPKTSVTNNTSVADNSVETPKSMYVNSSVSATDDSKYVCSTENTAVTSTLVNTVSVSNASVLAASSNNTTASATEFKVPHPVTSSDTPTVTVKGNPPRPLERTSTSHLVARIPKKRIDAYQMEYENATIQQPVNNYSSDNSTKSTDNNKQNEESNTQSESDKLAENDRNMFDAFGPTSMNPYGTDFTYEFGKAVVQSPYIGNPPSSSTNLDFIDMDDNTTITTAEEKKDNEDTSGKNSSNKFMDFDYIPPSPLCSARHSHLGSLAQVAQLKATSIVMPASPRTPLSSINSRSNKKDKQETKKDIFLKDQNVNLSKESLTEKVSDSHTRNNVPNSNLRDNNDIVNQAIKQPDRKIHLSSNENTDVSHNIPQNSNTTDMSLTQQMPPPEMPPPEIPPPQMDTNDKPMEKEVNKMNEQLQPPYSPEVNYTSEPLFSPPSILPPDSVNQEHEHSPTMPAVQTETNPPKPKEAPVPARAPSQVYPGTNYMDTTQGMDLSQRGMYSQDTNTGSSTCALQQTKPPQQPQGIYDNFSPPYASQASSGPSPSMGSSNPGSNQMLSPNMNSSMVNTATTTSYTASTSTSQMAGQRGYSSYYPMPSSAQQQAPPGPPPPLMQPSFGMDTSTPRDNTRPQNRTPGMVNSDRMTSPHPSNQPKNYSSYLSDTTASQHTQQREPQRLTHPEKESRSQRTSSVHSAQMSSTQNVGSNQRNRSSSVSGRSTGMGNDSRSSSHSGQYYSQTNYPSHSSSQMTSPPLHHRGPAPTEQQNSSSQRSSYDIPYSAASAAYGALASYSSPYNNSQSLTGNSSSSQSQSVQQSQHKSNSHSQRSASAAPKSLPTNKQPPAAHSGSHHRQQQTQQQASMQQSQQSVKSSSNRSSGSSSKSSSSKKASSSSKSTYDMDQAMMNSMFDARNMTPYFPFNTLHSPSSRNFHTDTNPYFSGMFSNHQRQSSQHKSSDMNNPFMFPHSRSQNGIGFNWGSMNHAHNNHHTSTSQSAHSNSSASHLSGFNFNLFGTPPEMNSSHTQDGLNISPIKLPHSQLLGQHGMDHNAALQHQSFYQNRGQMAPPMLQHPIGFLGHQHPGFDSRSMGASSMGAHFGGHGAASFGMPFLPD